MNCGLENLYGGFCEQFDGVDEEGYPDIDFTVTNDLLPCPAASISSDRIVIRKSSHQYGESIKLDSAHFYAEKRTFRQLGLLILATVFSTEIDTVKLILTHHASHIRMIEINAFRATLKNAFDVYNSHPFSFIYRPTPVHAIHPLHGSMECCDHLFPTILLTNEDELCITDEHWNNRDIIKGFGSDEGSVRFAELLLNISLPATEKDRIELEAFPGYRSVSKWSIEARFLLPNSREWPDGGL